MSNIKKGLGKGLSALISSEEKISEIDSAAVLEIDINKIEPNKNQPRRNFNEESLAELATSIKEFGIIQPIIVNEEDGYYQIVAGERRWRAARMLKLQTVPAIVKNYSESDTLSIALIENIQREDLNPIEEALCYQRLMDMFFFKQEDIAKKVGKNRNTISYTLSLLNLDPRVQNFIAEGRLKVGHARKLLDVKEGDSQFHLADKIIDNEFSIKETEQAIEELAKEPKEEIKEKAKKTKTYDQIHFENTLKNMLGTKVNLKSGKNKGKIEIEYYSNDELDRILCLFNDKFGK
ncbi:MAG: ParB/RepB/Spo0J family partition protein [Defluviitaleaceae bacterium]|nr:ParB/RepB/Spo0J family partition protein [Defluviitaleaceae bacterium]